MKFTIISFLTCTLPLISAHFTLDFPASRGFDEDIEPQFCGGFNSSSSTRSLFPLNSAPILIDSHHNSADVGIQISFNSNPTSFNQFNQTTNGTGYGNLMSFGTINGQGEWCFHVDVASLGVAGIGNGSLATIQVIFNGGDGVLLQCADVILSSTYTASNVTCANVTSAATTPTISNSTSVVVSSASSTASGVVPAATSAKSSAGRVIVGSIGGLIGLISMMALV